MKVDQADFGTARVAAEDPVKEQAQDFPLVIATLPALSILSRQPFCSLNFQSSLSWPFSRSQAVTYSAACLCFLQTLAFPGGIRPRWSS